MSPVAARATAVQRGVRLEIVTVVWMAAEGALAIGAGIAARSVLLTAFGFDSLIELLSGAVLLWRLRVEGKLGPTANVDRVESLAARISTALLVLLCGYVAITSVVGLVIGLRPDGSLLGIGVAAAAVIVMPLLAVAKARANRLIASAALRADIAETITCAYMAAVTLAGIGLGTLLGLWWIQYLAALALLIWLVPETREAFEAARGERHNHATLED